MYVPVAARRLGTCTAISAGLPASFPVSRGSLRYGVSAGYASSDGISLRPFSRPEGRLSRVSNSADRISAPPRHCCPEVAVCACTLRCSYPPDPPGLERGCIKSARWPETAAGYVRHPLLGLCDSTSKHPSDAWMCRPARVSGSGAGISPCHGLPLHAGRACADQHQCRCRFSRHRAAPTTQSRAASR